MMNLRALNHFPEVHHFLVVCNFAVKVFTEMRNFPCSGKGIYKTNILLEDTYYTPRCSFIKKKTFST